MCANRAGDQIMLPAVILDYRKRNQHTSIDSGTIHGGALDGMRHFYGIP